MNIPAELSEHINFSWTSCASTDVGHMRRANEDSFLDARENGLWVVADGMGGHSRGDLASQTIIRQLVDFAPGNTAEDSIDDLKSRLYAANTACRDKARGDVIGSTVAILLSQGGMCYCLWAGDSRIYRLRDDELEQITEDHSLVQELYKRGEISANDLETHPSSNVITRAIGVHETLEVAVVEAPVKPGDRFLVCSDGLFKDVKIDEIKNCLAAPTPNQALRDLVAQALARGGSDNVTAIVVQAAFS